MSLVLPVLALEAAARSARHALGWVITWFAHFLRYSPAALPGTVRVRALFTPLCVSRADTRMG